MNNVHVLSPFMISQRVNIYLLDSEFNVISHGELKIVVIPAPNHKNVMRTAHTHV